MKRRTLATAALAVALTVVAAAPAAATKQATTVQKQRITLKPVRERKLSADQVIARLRPKLAQIPGMQVFLSPVQDVRVGGRMSRAQFQYSLQTGDLDELNSAIGLVLAEETPPELAEALAQVQHDLFDLGGEISIPGHALLGDAQVARLEATLESWNAELPALKEFILPGGTRAAAAAHLARTVCRRAERAVVALGEKEKVGEPARRYLNRLSDLLFIAGRRLNRHAGRTDVQWRHERKKPR